MLLGLPHPAQIFGLVQMQSKRNPSVQEGLSHNPILLKSSYVQCKSQESNLWVEQLAHNSILQKTS